LTALSIPLLSSVKAKKLTNLYPDLNSLLTTIESEELGEKIKETLGEETHKEIKKYFQNPENQKIIKELN
jgi:NAD-dependent DNA ligase